MAGLLSKSYATGRAGNRFRSRQLRGESWELLPASGGDTTYLAAVDAEGNMVSLIQSNYSYLRIGHCGAAARALRCRIGARLFSFDPGSPNTLAGHKRPLHTIIPGFMTRGDDRIAFGIMGGFNQAQAHAQFVANIADYKMNIQAAIEAPRFTKYTFDGCDVEMEDRIAESERKKLEVARAQDIGSARLFFDFRRRTSGEARFQDRSEFRGFRSAQGWGSGA